MTASSVLTPAPATRAADRINPAAEAWAAFQKDTANHQLTVLHEQGLYRHFRMAAPGTRWGSWDIITWPGHLATSGDIADGLTFSREPDMVLDFFGHAGGKKPYYADDAPSIDFRYWAEKLQGDQRDTVRAYVHEDFVAYVKQTLTERLEGGYYSRLTQQLVDELIAEVETLDETEAEARQWLNEHEPEVPDSWDHDFKDYTFHFQVACYAINAAVQAYLARPAAPAAQ
jgi:hypothetical protein